MARKDLLILVLVGAIFILIVTIPYIWAYRNAGTDYQFGGFLLNPKDGNSYLAKMYQGWFGAWKFSLPYTYEAGSGGYLFLFYIALGHLARLVNSSLQITYHATRIISSILLVSCIWFFFSRTLITRRSRWLAFILALFGSGLGWLAVSFGLFTSDFWVAEGYPFLAAYANPHFPLGIAILILLLAPNDSFNQKPRFSLRYLPELIWSFLSLLLAIILPFGVIISIFVLGAYGFWRYLNESESGIKERTSINLTKVQGVKSSWRKLIFICIGGLPMLVYQLWVTQSNPELAAWNVQNLTVSPPIWDLLVSYSPIILLAVPGGYLVWKSKQSKTGMLLIWAIVGILLLYFPWNLQRRFILGYMIPLAGLAAIELDHLFDRNRRLGLAIALMVFLLIIPSNLMIIVGGIQAINSQALNVLLYRQEITALDWIAANTDREALVLSSPEMGLFIPAYSGRQVLYGHPFETIESDEMQAVVEDFYIGLRSFKDLPVNEGENYIFYGPREKQLGKVDFDREFELVYSTEQIQIFEVLDQNNASSLDDIQ